MGEKLLSVCVICFNEESNIGRCLESVRWADEIVVVDSHSTDRTYEIARRYTDRVILNAWPGFVAQKNIALQRATGKWVLCLDADEEVSPELRTEIEKAIRGDGNVAGYSMPRRTRYLGKWIKHCGWYPDRKVRLVRNGRAKWGGIDPHDKLLIEGEVAKLNSPINHYNYRDFSHQLRTIQQFSDVVVAEKIKGGGGFSLFKLMFHPPFKFLGVYFWKLGFLDGFAGFVIACASSFYVFVKQVKLWEKGREGKNGAAGNE